MKDLGLELKHESYLTGPRIGPVEVPIWLWPNVLSLDAACIAVLWNAFLARSLGLHTGKAELLILGLSVWVIYVIDHVMDARQPVPVYPEPVRKVFFRRHSGPMSAAAGAGTVAAGVLAVLTLPQGVFRLGVAIVISVSIYLGAVHLTPVHQRRRWPREVLVALLFTIGTILPLAFMSGAQRSVIIMSGGLFFLLAWANCCTMETLDWHRANRNFIAAPHVTALWVSRHLTEFAGLIIAFSACMAIFGRVPLSLAAAIVLSSLAMAFAVSQRNAFGTDVRSLLVDAALLSPLLLPFAL